MTVGTRELKNRLSHFLRQVREGERVLVTDRGTVVAELRPVPPAPSDEQAIWQELAASGSVSLGRGRCADLVPARRRRGGPPASRMIEEDRE